MKKGLIRTTDGNIPLDNVAASRKAGVQGQA